MGMSYLSKLFCHFNCHCSNLKRKKNQCKKKHSKKSIDGKLRQEFVKNSRDII